ncbi:TIGR02300 family protein [Rhodovulum sulfidophilum]|uniref:TIGR02300 family protein n=1 Tax=Rhodovulum sulfidophilum TaxID=35806 RepID=UPI00192490A3|nr:TIGR02300 family protein [Rhodovulum sulfidophilum]MBL3574485.1 TIGR02300 family protein [Rhodovulum sulfidophilum]MCE8431823.1 TIGR02300 family protein [Rhodovulum sulfidophilum]MCF4118160.1 TIGR02300 family protein [Rhodovulum sulfidophilum]
MPKEEWGVKRVCPQCSTRFYDLQRDPMTCPSCGHSFPVDSLAPGKQRPLIAEKAAPAKARNDEELDSDDAIIDDDDDGNDVDLGDDVLEDDDDDNVSLDDIADMSSEDDDET